MRTFPSMPRQLTCALLLMMCACAHGPRPIGATGPVVEKVELNGVEALSKSELAAGLATQPTGPWPWSEKQRLDRGELRVDLRRIETWYQRHGFYDARVVSARVVALPRGKVRVEIDLEEGAPTRIEKLQLQGLDALPADVRKRILERLPAAEGGIARADDYLDTRAQLLLRLQEAGYAWARVEGSMRVFPERDAAWIELCAVPGPLVTLGDLRIAGLRIVSRKKVLAVARRNLPRGQLYSPRAIKQAQAAIFELGLFQTVRIALDEAALSPTEAPVRVAIDERPAQALRLGGGLAIERGVQRVQLSAGYDNVSLFEASRLSLEGSAGLRLFPSLLNPREAGIGGEASAELVVPEVAPRLDFATELSYERALTTAFEADVLTVRVGTPFHVQPRFRITPSVGFSRYFALTTDELVPPVSPELLPACTGRCQLPVATLELSFDRRDDLISPSRGYLLLAEARYAPPLLDSAASFLQLAPEARGYVPLSRALVLAGRLRLGEVFALGSTSTVPIVARLFGGGDAGHRGFGPEQLSPMAETTEGDFLPVGGESLWLASLELRWRLSKSWGLALFTDYGQVAIGGLDLGDGQLAVGAGARYYTLAGPIRLDVGWRPARQPRLAVNTGNPVEQRGLDYLSLTVSIGEAF